MSRKRIHKRPEARRQWSDSSAVRFGARQCLQHAEMLGLLLLGIAILAGCSPYKLAKRSLHSELNEYPRYTDGKYSCREYKRWADDEWSLIQAEMPVDAISSDYESGFLQGFVDYVFAGGTVAPPPMPPRRYWRLPYRNERGQQAIRQWFSGFEHGAQVAQEKGYRDLAVIPSSLLEGEVLTDSELPEELDRAPGGKRIPAVPNEATEPPRELLLPSPDVATRTGGKTPGGLPLPVTDEAVPMPRGEAVSAASEPTVTTTSGHAMPSKEVNRRQRQGASSIESDEKNAPPPPPWQSRKTGNPRNDTGVRPAGAILPITGKENEQNTAADAEFDPFVGTRFAELSRTSYEESVSDTLAETPWQPRSEQGLTGQTTAILAAGPLTEPAVPIRVAPLTVIKGIPDDSPLPLTPAPVALGAKTPDEPQPEHPAKRRVPEEQTTDAKSLKGQEKGTLDNTNTAPEATVGERETGESGWHAVEPRDRTQWKSKS